MISLNRFRHNQLTKSRLIHYDGWKYVVAKNKMNLKKQETVQKTSPTPRKVQCILLVMI